MTEVQHPFYVRWRGGAWLATTCEGVRIPTGSTGRHRIAVLHRLEYRFGSTPHPPEWVEISQAMIMSEMEVVAVASK